MRVDGTNLSMIRGDSEAITISFNDKDMQKISLATGDKIYFTVKTNTTTQDKLIQKLITTFDDGNAIIEIDSIDTKNLAYRDYVYDVQWVDNLGRVTTVITPSTLTILPEVTFE